jgi:hypothetical protein
MHLALACGIRARCELNVYYYANANIKFGREVGFKLILGISFFCQHNSTGGGFLVLKQIIQGE